MALRPLARYKGRVLYPYRRHRGLALAPNDEATDPLILTLKMDDHSQERKIFVEDRDSYYERYVPELAGAKPRLPKLRRRP